MVPSARRVVRGLTGNSFPVAQFPPARRTKKRPAKKVDCCSTFSPAPSTAQHPTARAGDDRSVQTPKPPSPKNAPAMPSVDLFLGPLIQCAEAATLGMPFEVWKTRMGRFRQEGTLEAFANIYKQGGVKAFWAGTGPKMIESGSKVRHER